MESCGRLDFFCRNFFAVCETLTYRSFLLVLKNLDILELLLLMKINDKLGFLPVYETVRYKRNLLLPEKRYRKL